MSYLEAFHGNELRLQLSVLPYVIEISVFLPVTIAGLQFTVDGGGESRKKYQSIMLILQEKIYLRLNVHFQVTVNWQPSTR